MFTTPVPDLSKEAGDDQQAKGVDVGGVDGLLRNSGKESPEAENCKEEEQADLLFFPMRQFENQ